MNIELDEYKKMLLKMRAELSTDADGMPVPFARGVMLLLETVPGLLGEEARRCTAEYDLIDLKLRDFRHEKTALSKLVSRILVIGISLSKSDSDVAKSVLKAFSDSGNDAKHAETRAMKREVFEWLDINFKAFGKMDPAAEAVTKQQPIKFRTARRWVGEWKKSRVPGEGTASQ